MKEGPNVCSRSMKGSPTDKPPRDEGREAFSQAQSGRGLSVKSVRASHMMSSRTPIAFWMSAGGQVRSTYANVGRERGKNGGE